MTFTRVLTAAVLLPIVVGGVWWGPTWLVAALVGLVALLALYEFFRLGERVGLRGYPRWTAACAAWLIFEQWAAGQVETWRIGGGLNVVRAAGSAIVPLELVFVVFVLGAAAIALGRGRAPEAPGGEVLPAVGISGAGLLFVALPLSYLVRLHGVDRSGPKLLLFVLALVWAGDTLAYFVGRAIGRLPMAPVLSPKKTWEGAAANVIGSFLVAVLFARWLEIETLHLLVVAGLANVAGQVGDLLESAYKRSAGVKDSGALLPGHGGMLDRIDSLIFAGPVVWCYFGMILRGRG